MRGIKLQNRNTNTPISQQVTMDDSSASTSRTKIGPDNKPPLRWPRGRLQTQGLGKEPDVSVLRLESQWNADFFKQVAGRSQRLIKGHSDGKMKTWHPEGLTSSQIKEFPKQRGSTHGSARKISASFTATWGERPFSLSLSLSLLYFISLWLFKQGSKQ